MIRQSRTFEEFAAINLAGGDLKGNDMALERFKGQYY